MNTGDLLPYGRQSIVEEDVEAVAEVLRGDWLTTGPSVRQFEEDLSTLAGGVPTVAVTSGTAALHVAYAAAGIGPGDEVVCAPMTFVATAATAVLRGASVVFADVSPETGNLLPEAAAAALTPRTRVVSAVDYAGHPAPLDELVNVAHDAGALLLEDAAHSIGGTWQGRPVGSVADLTTFSFFPTKNLTTAEGGAVSVAQPGRGAAGRRVPQPRAGAGPRAAADRRRRRLAPGGARVRPELSAAGCVVRLGFQPAAPARVVQVATGRDPRPLHRRTVRCGRCADAGDPARRGPMWHLYALRVLDGRRRALYEHLRANGIGVQVNYIPVHWHPVFADLGYQRGLCPNAEEFYRQQLSLPLFPDLTDDDVDRVIELIHKFF